MDVKCFSWVVPLWLRVGAAMDEERRPLWLHEGAGMEEEKIKWLIDALDEESRNARGELLSGPFIRPNLVTLINCSLERRLVSYGLLKNDSTSQSSRNFRMFNQISQSQLGVHPDGRRAHRERLEARLVRPRLR